MDKFTKKLLSSCKEALSIAWEWFPDLLDEEETTELRERLNKVQETIDALEKRGEVYQVLNDSGNPASHGEDNDLAIFETKEEAKVWIDYLVDMVGIERKGLTVRNMLLMEA